MSWGEYLAPFQSLHTLDLSDRSITQADIEATAAPAAVNRVIPYPAKVFLELKGASFYTKKIAEYRSPLVKEHHFLYLEAVFDWEDAFESLETLHEKRDKIYGDVENIRKWKEGTRVGVMIKIQALVKGTTLALVNEVAAINVKTVRAGGERDAHDALEAR